MRDTSKVALARIVMAHREHVISIQPFDKGLLGTVLRYPYELRQPKPIFSAIRKRKSPKDMVALAMHILDSKTGHFDPAQFKDEYEIALKKLVRRKAKGKPIEPPAEREPPSNVINLMDALRQSLGKKTAAAKKKSAQSKGRSHAKRRARRVRKAA
jgi:Ku protein